MLEKIKEILKEYLEKNGLFIYNIEYVKDGLDMVLRVYIDKEEGYISTDECEMVSNYLSDELDKLDLIADKYILEVSSPGMDRELSLEEHFNRYIGEMVDVYLKEPSLLEDFKNEMIITGKLVSYIDKVVTILVLVDLKKGNRKPGQKVSPKSIVEKELSFNEEEYKKVSLSVIF